MVKLLLIKVLYKNLNGLLINKPYTRRFLEYSFVLLTNLNI